MTYITGFDHLQLAMPAGGEAEARAFYGDLLGLAEIEKPPQLASRGGCWFALGTQMLHLGIDTPFSPALKAHPAFTVSDLEALRTRLKASSIATTDDFALSHVRRFYAADPFGNRLEFIRQGDAF